jgi:putative NADH-flavin reductase
LGRQTVMEALERGHRLTVFSRRSESVHIEHPNLRLQSGNVLDVSSVQQAIKGHDAVICTLGLSTLKAIGPPVSKRSYVLSKGTENILAAMAVNNTKRFICVTAIGTGDSAGQCTLFARLVLRYGLRWLFSEKDKQEQCIKNSDTDWTIIRPTAMTNGGKKGAIVAEKFRTGILTHVSRADVAAVMIDMLEKQESHNKSFIVTYPRRFGDSVRWAAGYFGRG